MHDPSETCYEASKKCGCVCTCCQANNLLHHDCVISVRSNYDLQMKVSVTFANR